jgi:DNA-binding NtrC family response regulator
MNTRLVASAVLLLVGIGVAEPVLACGEKFLMRSRGTRFQRAALARTPASILVYANPALNLPKALANVSVVTSPDEFEAAMARGGWDLVLVDVADTIVVPRQGPNTNAPIVLPVAFNATRSELAAAKKQHQRILNTPIKNQSFLDAIDHALADRPAAASQTDKSGR